MQTASASSKNRILNHLSDADMVFLKADLDTAILLSMGSRLIGLFGTSRNLSKREFDRLIHCCGE
jgi:hypothetical protein